MNHWVWDDDPDESLCGLDVNNQNWTEGKIDCPNCLEIDAFMKVVEAFHTNFDMRDSLVAAVGIWSQQK